MAKTCDAFLTGVKRRVTVPASQPLFEDTDMLAIADDVIKAYIVPLLTSLRQDYFVTRTVIPCVSGQNEYDIPYRSVGRGLRDLKLIDSNGGTWSLALIKIEDVHRFSTSSEVGEFYFRGDKIVVLGTVSSSMNLEVWWEEPPQQMVLLENASVVVSTTLTVVTVVSVPTGIIAGTLIDFIRGKSGNGTLDRDIAVTAVTTTTISFTSGDIPTDLVAGDYITVAETSPVVQLPNEAQPLLETRTCQKILAALSDFEGAGALAKDVVDEEKYLKMVLEPRIEGEPDVIINRTGLLRGRRFVAGRGLFAR